MMIDCVSCDCYQNILQFSNCKLLRKLSLTSKKYYKYTNLCIQGRLFNKLSEDELKSIFLFCDKVTLLKIIEMMDDRYNQIIQKLIIDFMDPGTHRMLQITNKYMQNKKSFLYSVIMMGFDTSIHGRNL
jgi:hypothetical protein